MNTIMPEHPTIGCIACGRQVHPDRAIHVAAVPPQLAAITPTAEGTQVCDDCVASERLRTLTRRLHAERGELSELEAEVARSAAAGTTIAGRLSDDFVRNTTKSQRMADTVAQIGGSWRFVIGALLVIAIWMTANVMLTSSEAFDPYPFILLNLALSCLAALQAPIILMSQNRSAARDRVQADQDFLVNLKAELEISGLNAKLDHLLHTRWEDLLLMQQVQLDLLTQLQREIRQPSVIT